MNDMPELKKRFQTALDILLAQPSVDPSKIAAIGYCMGGGIVLNMARFGLDMNGIVVFHGSLGTETPVKKGQIKTNILVLTGGSDPFVPQEQVQAFEKEMKDAAVNYTLKIYPDAKHAFTSPEATLLGEKFGIPLAYNKAADKDAWLQMQSFFKNIFK